MNRTCFLLAMGLACQDALLAQTQPGAMGFQRADSLAAGRGGRGINIVPLLRPDTGKPFSATVTTQTTQTLVDGTHVSQTTTMLEYRDADGRTRTEPDKPVASNIEIRDPVAGVMYGLNPSNKFAVKIVMPAAPARPASPPVAGGRGGRGVGGPTEPGSNADSIFQAMQRLQELVPALRKATTGNGDIVEDLGTATINGVPAQGTRITTVVPVGAIGNDKEFRSVSERWFSPDLNLLIKSVSTDPRFGTTTYELTNISRQPPEPSLFQVPADYSILSNPQTAPPVHQQPAQPAGKVIEEIEIRGVKGVPPDSLKAIMLSKVGEVYNEETLRGDFSALWKTGRFSDVQVKTEPGPRGGVIIRFDVTQR